PIRFRAALGAAEPAAVNGEAGGARWAGSGRRGWFRDRTSGSFVCHAPSPPIGIAEKSALAVARPVFASHLTHLLPYSVPAASAAAPGSFRCGEQKGRRGGGVLTLLPPAGGGQ